MDAGFDENESEFGILVFAITLKMLADSDGLIFVVNASVLLDNLTGETEKNKRMMLPS